MSVMGRVGKSSAWIGAVQVANAKPSRNARPAIFCLSPKRPASLRRPRGTAPTAIVIFPLKFLVLKRVPCLESEGVAQFRLGLSELLHEGGVMHERDGKTRRGEPPGFDVAREMHAKDDPVIAEFAPAP
jgi:hypothetical protein